ncbi:MAG: Hpt domain-containing protein [Acidobacteriia bacterium]|nr:Hpt domain-containing protein [Terriglobia bacterium]
MQGNDTALVLDREQLRDVTMDDQELMCEILAALIDDTSRQVPLLESAIQEQDSQKCMRLAHYSKGACANVGATAAAAVLKQIERRAATGDFVECSMSLAALAQEIDRLRSEARAFSPLP